MMKATRIVEAFAACRSYIALTVKPVRHSRDWCEHFVFMCEEGAKYAVEDTPSRREKAMRWLGFLQGTLWAHGLASIEELKAMNRPDVCDTCRGEGRYVNEGGIQWCSACKGKGVL